MVYNAEIMEIICLEDYEGFMIIKLNDEYLHVCFLAPYEFAYNLLHVGKSINIDLWLAYGTAKIIQILQKEIPRNPKVSGGIHRGEVIKVYNKHELRVNCGAFEIDIRSEVPIEVLTSQYIEAHGDYQIFFPDTDYSKDRCWDCIE